MGTQVYIVEFKCVEWSTSVQSVVQVCIVEYKCVDWNRCVQSGVQVRIEDTCVEWSTSESSGAKFVQLVEYKYRGGYKCREKSTS